jgi:hypothetical protein
MRKMCQSNDSNVSLITAIGSSTRRTPCLACPSIPSSPTTWHVYEQGVWLTPRGIRVCDAPARHSAVGQILADMVQEACSASARSTVFSLKTTPRCGSLPCFDAKPATSSVPGGLGLTELLIAGVLKDKSHIDPPDITMGYCQPTSRFSIASSASAGRRCSIKPQAFSAEWSLAGG